jgi:hypothetical protein
MSHPGLNKSMRELIADLKEELNNYMGPEERRHKRNETPPIPVIVQPLDENLEPAGSAFQAVLRNITEAGIGLSFGEHVHGNFIRIEGKLPSGKKFKSIIRVRHCTPAGVIIGGEFMDSQPPEIV